MTEPALTVAKDRVVVVAYTLRDPDGQLIDAADSDEPMPYLHGHDQLLPRFEAALEGLSPGETRAFEIPAVEGYGERDQGAVQHIDRSHLPPSPVPEVGMAVMANFGMGERPYRIIAVEPSRITLDMNHPLAGVDLHFSVEVLAVREATADELAHGHAHGPDGHHHHH